MIYLDSDHDIQNKMHSFDIFPNWQNSLPTAKLQMIGYALLEFLGNSLTQTNQKFIRLYYLGYWSQIVQFDEQNKSSTK